jgi:two-component system sensor histidine kinase CpxA
MKVSYPLSLKVSLWLMLNLLLLAALALGFLVMQGGLRWDALVAGPSGDRMQALANVISGEASAATGDARTAVLKRFGEAYNAEFFLFTIDETQVAGTPVELPPEVRARMEFRPGGMGPGGFRGGRGGRRGMKVELDGPPHPDSGEKGPRELEKGPREGFEKSLPPPREFEKGVPDKGRGGSPEAGRREPPPGMKLIGEPPAIGRFVVRGGSPVGYWVGIRVPFVAPERGYPMPAKIVARVSSMWSLLHLLNLQNWVLAATAVLLLSVLFWLPLVRGITRSVGQLTRATEQIAEGRFETRVSTRRRDELGKLGESVNRMATRLDAHMNGQKRFLGDVAHELCSPLARLQMATGILAEQSPKTLQETVTDVREEVQQMSTLVNELLAFTKAGLRPREVACQAVELAILARDAVAREDATGRVTLEVPAELRASAEPDLLSRALGNLVRNALRYAGEAGPITVTAARDNDRVSIVIEDHGPGVPAADLDRLGEPFFRPELARTRESGGVGLGLAIVRTSVAASGGEVRLSNSNPRGFRAEIRLNAA